MGRFSVIMLLLLVGVSLSSFASAALEAEPAEPAVQAIDPALEPVLGSDDQVLVTVILKEQPIDRIASEVQARYLPKVREKNLAVRAILGKYAGRRDLQTPEEVRAQAELESRSVTAEDRLAIKGLNDSANDLLKQMRVEIAKRVENENKSGLDSVSEAITRLGGKIVYRLGVFNCISAKVPGNKLAELSRHPLARHICASQKARGLLNKSVPAIYASTFWNALITGGSYEAALIDTGVDMAHPGLANSSTGSRTWTSAIFHDAAVEDSYYYSDDPEDPDDLEGHGTALAGIVWSSDSTYRGVAHGATTAWNIKAGYKAWAGGGASFPRVQEADVQAALDYLALAGDPDVVCFPFRSDQCFDPWDYYTQMFDVFVRNCACSAVIAADYSTECGYIYTPATAYNAMSVAATSIEDTTTRIDDVPAGQCFGPTSDWRNKPDLVAPGYLHYDIQPRDSFFTANNLWESESDYDVYKYDAPYDAIGGASAAAAHVTGAVLLLNDAGIIDPREVKAVLINSADTWPPGNDPGWHSSTGYGYLNLNRAYLERGNLQLHSLAAPHSYRLYRIPAMPLGGKATAVWNMRGMNSICELAAYLYRQSDGAEVDNDEPMGYDDRDNVRQVSADESDYYVLKVVFVEQEQNLGPETYALASTVPSIEVSPPTLNTPVDTFTPPLNAKFQVRVRVNNPGTVDVHNVSLSLTLPAGLELVEGSLTQDIGSITPGGTGYAYFTLRATTTGAKTVLTAVESDSYGLSLTAGGYITVTPGPADTVNPATALVIGQPTYQVGGTERLSGGDFEGATITWTTSGTVVLDNTTSHAGTQSLRIGPGAASAYNVVAISSAATRAFLTFWYRADASILAPAGLRLETSGGTIHTEPLHITATAGDWTKCSIDVSKYKGQAVRLYFYTVHSMLNSTLWIDDISLKQNETVWADDSNLLTMCSRDDNAGVDYTEYRYGPESWVPYTDPFTLAGRSGGANALSYHSVDNGANTESIISTNISYDAEPPVSVLRVWPEPKAIIGGTEKVDNGGFESGLTGWTTSATVSIVASPCHGGSSAAMVQDGNFYQDIPVRASPAMVFLSCWVQAAKTSGTAMASVEDPDTRLYCDSAYLSDSTEWTRYIWDVSGFRGRSVRISFESRGSEQVYVDDVSLLEDGDLCVEPGTEFAIASGERTVVEEYRYALGGVDDQPGQTFTIDSEGRNAVAYRARDILGKWENQVHTVISTDRTSPTGSIIINDGDPYTIFSTVTLSLPASDNFKVSTMRIQMDTGVWEKWRDYESSVAYGFQNTTSGTKTISVQYADPLGHTSDIYSDSIEYVPPVSMSIPEAKQIANGAVARLTAKIVTAIFPSDGCFYVEEPDRSGGIRARSVNLPGDIGIYATVEGLAEITSGERDVEAITVQFGASAGELKPVAMPNRSLGGGAFHNQPAAPGGLGLSNVGLLVRTTGEVTGHDAGSFYLTDASLADPVLVDGHMLGGWLPPVGSYVIVTGISGLSDDGGLHRVLRTRGTNDVQIRQLHAAFVYYTELSDIGPFETLLEADGIQTDMIHFSDVLGADWSKYDVIIVGSGTGVWTDTDRVNAIIGTGKPIVAIGSGGHNFLRAVPGLAIATADYWITTASHAVVLGGDIYSYPYALGGTPGDVFYVYTSPGVEARSLLNSGGTVNWLLRQFDDLDHSVVVSEADRYYLWGFYGQPTAMTTTGAQLFVDLVYRTVMP